MEIDLQKLGKHNIILPKSLAVMVDLTSVWAGGLNRAQLGRVCACAIAVGIDHTKRLPAYPVAEGDPIKFGFKVMERLLDNGVSISDIYDYGSKILVMMFEALPKEEQIEEQANFT